MVAKTEKNPLSFLSKDAKNEAVCLDNLRSKKKNEVWKAMIYILSMIYIGP